MPTSPDGPILITGGAGFIGCALAERLLAEGAGELWVADVLHPQVHPDRRLPARLPDQVRFVPFDVSSDGSWDALLAAVRPTCVVHLAAETGTGQSLTEATRHATVNVLGTAQLLDALARHHDTPHLVLSSSRAVYGEGQWTINDIAFSPGVRRHADLQQSRWAPLGAEGAVPCPARADITPTNPTSIYGATKLAQEHMMRLWADAMGASLSIVRIQNAYGPGQSLTNSYTGIVTMFARLAMRGDQIEIYEDGQILRDFVYIDDVVDALVRCIGQPPSGERILDVGSGVATTILDLGTMISDIVGSPTPAVSGKFRDGDVRAAWADMAMTTDQIGYVPSTMLREGLGQLLEWMKDQIDVIS